MCQNVKLAMMTQESQRHHGGWLKQFCDNYKNVNFVVEDAPEGGGDVDVGGAAGGNRLFAKI